MQQAMATEMDVIVMIMLLIPMQCYTLSKDPKPIDPALQIVSQSAGTDLSFRAILLLLWFVGSFGLLGPDLSSEKLVVDADC
jgi:hypothetical protein